MTCGPELPKPNVNRPRDNESMLAAVIAINEGVLLNTGTIPDPKPIVSVFPAAYASRLTLSKLYASGTQT